MDFKNAKNELKNLHTHRKIYLIWTSYSIIARCNESNCFQLNLTTQLWFLREILKLPNQDDRMNMTESRQWWTLRIEHDQNWNRQTLTLLPGSS